MPDQQASPAPGSPPAPPGFLDDQREFFDKLITEQWDEYSDPAWDAVRRREVELALRRTGPVRRVIDLGCGCGFHDVALAQSEGVVEVRGVDYSERSVETAEREYPHASVERVAADVFTLPQADYDLAVSFQVIEHLRDAEAFMRACASQVRPGGFVAICTPNSHRLDNRLRELRRRPTVLLDPQHFQEFSREDLRRLGDQAGLELLGIDGYGLSVRVRGRELVPRRVHLRVGQIFPAIANGLCATYRVR